MKSKFILKSFYNFLRNNNAQEKFFLKLKKGRQYRLFYGYPVDESDYISSIAKNCPQNLFTNAFNWSDNNEERYWMFLSWQWEDYIYDVTQTIGLLNINKI